MVEPNGLPFTQLGRDMDQNVVREFLAEKLPDLSHEDQQKIMQMLKEAYDEGVDPGSLLRKSVIRSIFPSFILGDAVLTPAPATEPILSQAVIAELRQGTFRLDDPWLRPPASSDNYELIKPLQNEISQEYGQQSVSDRIAGRHDPYDS